MATRASSKKEPTQKSKPKADQPAERAATPQPATDLISPSRKKPATETRTLSEVCGSADQQGEDTRRRLLRRRL